MAYKFQMGAAKMSGSLEQEGPINIDAIVASQNVLQIAGTTVIDNSRNLTAVAVSGSSFFDVKKDKLRIQGIAVEATAQELNLLDAAVGNTVVNDRAVIYGGAGQVAATSVAASAAITAGTSFIIGSADLNETDLEKLDGITDGTGAANKALVLDGSRDVDTINALGIASMSSNWTNAGRTVADMGVVTTIDINGGSIDGATVGAAAQSSVRATTLSASSTLDVDGAAVFNNTMKLTGIASDDCSATDDIYFEMSDGFMKKESAADLRDLYFSAVSGDASIAAGGALTIAAQAVENSMLADDAVGADELAANAVVNASIASNAAIDMDKLDGGSLASALTDLAQGDLMYAGDVDDSSNLKSITFSNLEDAIFGNVSGDATIAAGGVLSITADSVTGLMLAPAVAGDGLAQDGSGNLDLDLNELTAATVNVAADSIAIVDADDSDASKKESIADLVSAMAGAGLTATAGVLSTDGGSVTDWGLGASRTLSEGFNYRAAAALASDQDLQLPGAAAPSIGDVVHVKAPASLGGFDLTISCYAAQTVDGYTSIELETGGAAVSMVYLASGSWGIF